MKKGLRILSLSFVILLTGCDAKIASTNQEYTGHFSDIQYSYLTNDDPSNTTPYNGNMSEGDPKPVVLSWKASGIKKYIVKIYDNIGLTEPVFTYVTTKNKLEFYNGKLNTTYYWTVSDIKEKVTSQSLTFRVNSYVAGPRNLKVEGVENIRDIGGWGIYDESNHTYSRYMKQGMLYRSGRFNEDKAESVNVTVSEDGIRELKENLKIKTEIDLRRSSNNEIGSLTHSALGEDVNYYNFPMLYEGKNLLTFTGKSGKDTYTYDNPGMIKQVFEVLANRDSYPVVFHCSIGKDRTGCIAFLVEALMGFKEEYIYRDYMFTNFANAGMCKLQEDVLNDGRYGYTLMNYTNGTNLRNKTYNYLKDEVGISQTTLDSVINILKENQTDSTM